MNDYEKRKYIINNKKRYHITLSKEQEHLINKINELRKGNNINKLNYDEIICFKDLIFDIYSEPIILDYENIFKFSNGNYLLKYHLNEFLKRLNDKDKNISNILLNNSFNKIILLLMKMILHSFFCINNQIMILFLYIMIKLMNLVNLENLNIKDIIINIFIKINFIFVKYI